MNAGITTEQDIGKSAMNKAFWRILPLILIAYLVFATVSFTIPMLTSSGWAEVLHVRELAVGAAAINTIGQIGEFVAPYGWGIAKDATGSFQPALITLSIVALLMSTLLLLLRHQVRGQAMRVAAA